MADILIALASQHAELADLIDGCTNDDWERPTRCEGWDVAAVLVHLAQTDEFATASVHGDFDRFRHGFLGNRERQTVSVDDAAAAQVDADRGAGGDAIRQRWHEASQAMRAALDAADPHERVTWISGQLSVQTLATTRLSECWLRHITRLAWRTLPYAFERADAAMHGPVALDLVGPNGEPWRFDPDAPALTTIRGSAAEFCEVAARRVDPDATDLVGDGPDAATVLRLVRTYAQ